MKYSTVESEYLIALLKAAIKNTAIPDAPDGIDWKKFVSLSKKQQVYSIIAVIMDRLPLPDEQAAEIKLYNQNELLRIISMKSEQELIESELEERGIKFMLLKGSLLRKYYPQQKMRQMSDVDILYDGEKKSELFEIMRSMDYSVLSCSENSDDFTKKPFYTFEFHRDLFFKGHDFYFDFSDVWSRAEQSSENSCKYYMKKEDLYLHSIAHMYKHYVLGGFGVRFLADTYLMLKSEADSLDMNYIRAKLNSFDLVHFEELIREISLILFDGGELSDEQMNFLNKSLEFGIYGDSNEGVKIYFDEYVKKNGGKGTILGFYLSKLFPSAEFMKRSFPILEKRPYLMPAYYIFRLIQKFIFKRKKSLSNYNTLKEYNKERHGG